MTSITKNWNTDLNYWNLHPIIKTIKVFNDLYEGDKSKNKDKSSNIMWAIAMLCDPHDENPWKGTPKADIKTLLKTDYIKDKKFDWNHPTIVQLIKEYEEKCLTPSERSLNKLQAKMEERSIFIENTPYTLDGYDENNKPIKGTASQLDSMLSNTKKIQDQLDDIKAQIEKENSEGHLKGGGTKSASEKKLL